MRVDGLDVLAVLRGDARGGRAGAGGRRADLHRGRALPRCAARDRGRPEGLHRPRARSRRSARASASGASRATCAGPGSSRTRWPSRSRARPPTGCARGSPPPRPSRRPTPALLFEHAFVDPPASFARDLAELRRILGSDLAELTLLEAINDCFHVELERDGDVMVLGEDVGRAGGVFRATAGLRDRFGARPLLRHPARRGRDPRRRGRALHGRLQAGLRDAVRRLLVPLPRPADHARRPLPLAERRQARLPAHRAHALRRRRPRPRAARRLARGLLRPHARREGRDPVDARRREGPARGGDPRPGPGRRARAEAPLPDAARRGPRGRARRPARARRGSRAREAT